MNIERQLLFIPCKPFAQAKTRLCAIFNAGQREQLARSLYLHTLATVASCQTDFEVIVISSDEEALEHARMAGLGRVSESAAHGLNQALRSAVNRFPRRRGIRFSYLPIDLPHLCAADLDGLATSDAQHCVIAPDRHGTGTNFLSWPAQIDLPLAFGPSSFSTHCRGAERLGMPVRVVVDAHFEQDIDVPEDVPSSGAFAGPAS